MASSTGDNILPLANCRQIHFAEAGNPQSTCIILFFSGMLSVGTALESSIPCCFSDIQPHYIAPTIPGNGLSSTRPSNIPYHVNLCDSITALLEHLHPSDGSRDNVIEHIFVAGGSYGTVMAQMIFGAPFKSFPLGRKVRGMLLLAPFSPFREHADYTRNMTWSNWLSVGPPSQTIPWTLIPRLIRSALAMRCRDITGARALLDTALFNGMDKEELAAFEDYAMEKRGLSGEQLRMEMAQNALQSSQNWDGFVEGSDILHSNWGFDISTLDDEHVGRQRPVLIVYSESDPLGDGMALWLADAYPSSRLKMVPGGHLASLYHIEEIWTTMLDMSVLK